MSKARSPRDVCSTTIGTNGLIGALLRACGSDPAVSRAGRLRFGNRGWAGGLRELGRSIEREPQPQILAHPLFRVGGEELLHELVEVLLALAVLAQQALELGVVDLDLLALGERLERDLLAQRVDGVGPQLGAHLLGAAPG